VVYTELFLRDLCNPQATPKVPRKIRDRARSLLKHYPLSCEMDIAAEQAPDVFGED